MSENGKKLLGLVVFSGLVVAVVRHLIERSHWDWDGFFISWFIHTLGVGVLTPFAGAAILHFHKRMFGYEFEGKGDQYEEVIFAVLVTVVIAAIGILFVASYIPSDDY